MSKTPRLRRGIYLLPTVFTVGNLFCGFFSLVTAFRGDFADAALLIIVAGVLDGLDGRIARLTGTTSAFGNEFDSLADIVSFGVAPAMLAYHWGLLALGRAGWLVAFLFVVCAGMRLARFNIQSGAADKRYFAGLPSPSAGGALASLTFAIPEPPVSPWVSVLLAVAVGSLGLLMVSRLRYPSFKQLGLRSRRSYLYVLPLAAVLVAVAIAPAVALLALATAYLLSAPALWIFGTLRAGSWRSADVPPSEIADEPVVR